MPLRRTQPQSLNISSKVQLVCEVLVSAVREEGEDEGQGELVPLQVPVIAAENTQRVSRGGCLMPAKQSAYDPPEHVWCHFPWFDNVQISQEQPERDL